jgi:transposase
LNTKLHAVADAEGRPIRFFLSAGQVSDYTGALALLSSLTKADWLLADKGYDADWFREVLQDKGIKPCIPGRSSRDKPVKHYKRRYKRRHRIEIVFTQMTEASALALGAERDDIADLHLVFGDHDPVDQQFDELTALGEVGLGQPALHPLTELGR